jgi:hypothetical protein
MTWLKIEVWRIRWPEQLVSSLGFLLAGFNVFDRCQVFDRFFLSINVSECDKLVAPTLSGTNDCVSWHWAKVNCLLRVRSRRTSNSDSSIRSDSDCFLLQFVCTLGISLILTIVNFSEEKKKYKKILGDSDPRILRKFSEDSKS